MATEVTMPQMGADMTEGTLVRWIKQVGDKVERGEILAEIETDKATVELEAFDSGTLIEHKVAEGETVPVNTVIALLGDPSEATASAPAQDGSQAANGQKPETAAKPAEAAAPVPASTSQTPLKRPVPQVHENAPAVLTEYSGDTGDGGRIRISPVARRIALDEGVDVRAIKGSGPDGRILRRDVEAFLAAGKTAQPAAPARTGPKGDVEPTDATEAAQPAESEAEVEKAARVPEPAETPKPSEIAAAGGVEPKRPAAAGVAEPPEPSPVPQRRPAAAAPAAGEAQPLSRMRQAIARRMTASKQQQPHYYLTLDVDMTDALEFRKQLNAAASETQRVSINDLVVKACAVALQRHPKFNAEFGENGLTIHPVINISIGVALDEGLIAPALLDVGNKSLGRIAEEAKDLVNRAKGGRLRADEYSEGTFTITNLGAYGVETLIGIINPPQAAILGVGSVMPQPVVRNDEIVIRQVMKVALSADHRVTDGAEGARFIKEIQGLLENPASLAL